VCSAKFDLSQEETAKLAELVEPKATITSVEVMRDYAGRLEVILPNDAIPDRLHPNEVDRVCEMLPALSGEVSGNFRATAEKCRTEVRRIVAEGRLSELGSLHGQQSGTLQSVVSPEPQHQPHDQSYQGQYTARLQELVQKVPTVPSMRKQVHEYIVSRLPKFD